MLTDHLKPVCLSLISTDLSVSSIVETSATLFQKDAHRFHLLLTVPSNESFEAPIAPSRFKNWWLEISPNRVIMTVQGNAQLSYRHIWEQGVYGSSRYWLPAHSLQPNKPICLRNFTNTLTLDGHPLPKHLRVEYELWSEKVQLGRYILGLKIQH